jgi:dipeptidyl aminopeptidase/acylaminoacyl peptidase
MSLKQQNAVLVRCVSVLILLSCTCIFGYGQARPERNYETTGISYQTEDGWTIHGTLMLPKGTPPNPLPAVVMMSEPGLRIRTIYDPYLAVPLAQKGTIAILTIDPRGSAGSYKRILRSSP